MKVKEIEAMINWVVINYPDSIKFILDDYTMLLVSGHIRTNNIKAMISTFGIEFTLLCLEYLEDIEDYEKCAIFKERIDKYNKDYNLELPTKLKLLKIVK